MKDVFLSLQAEEDLRNIYDYINSVSKYYADVMIEDFFICLENLSLYPNMGVLFSYDNSYENVRQIFLKNYRIVYEVFDNRVEILTIVHSARNNY